ncbi:MAG: cadherin repeat domain-containing protein, partial [Planctomycetia bacterium]
LEVPPRITGPSGLVGAPTSSTTINENISSVFSFIADKPVTWSISGGLDQSKFSIDPVTGALGFLVSPDFERPNDSDRNNTYIVTIKATDAQGMFSSQTVTVTVRDVLENPANNGTYRPDISGAKVIYTNAIGISNGTITGFRVIFNESINAASFT